MKKLTLYGMVLLLWAVMPVYAQSPREQLNQLVQQMQHLPNDAALRERIVRLGAEIKPPPAVPEEANRREGRGKFAFRSAKSNEDYLAAAAEFEEAAKAAPWVAGYYSDLCTIYEKVERFAEAKRNCQIYLAGVSDAAQANDVKQRIAGLEFGLERANSPQEKARRQAAADEALIKSLDGARFDCPRSTNAAGTTWTRWFLINGNRLVQRVVVSNPNPALQMPAPYNDSTDTWQLNGTRLRQDGNAASLVHEVRADYISEVRTWNGTTYPAVICKRTGG